MAKQTNRLVRGRAFTLLEVLVALVIFGVITVAVSFTFDTALQTQKANVRRLEELGTVRAVFDYMTRDIQQAYASSNSTAAAFIAGSGQSSGPQGASGGGLLTMMTRGNRLLYDSQAGSTTGTGANRAAPSAGTTSNPQSETAMVRYDFDPRSRSLTRTVVGVPNLQILQQTTPDPGGVISNTLDDISVRFWDPTALTWRTDWDYEQQNQQSSTSGAASGTTGATGATASSSTSQTAAAGSATGDTTLPGMIEVTITIHHQDRTTATYVSTIPVMTSQVADGMAPPTNTATTSSSTTGTKN